MSDTRTKEQRSHIMRSVRSRDTGPEKAVRSLLHGLGYRYRLHRRDLPGRPDIVLPGRKMAIFVHGCFWHGHACAKGKLPKSRAEYWVKKIRDNQQRDKQAVSALRKASWRTLTIWQCELKAQEKVAQKLTRFIGTPHTQTPVRRPPIKV